MDFVTARGACEVVSVADAGERVQRFVAHAFREYLLPHGDSRTGAFRACEQGRVLVNDAPCQGHRVVLAGDVVTLIPSESDVSSGGSRRMVLDIGLQASAEVGGATRDGETGAVVGTEAARTFAAYYAAQQLCGPAEWDDVCAHLRRPLPLSVRLNRASPRLARTRAELDAAVREAGAAGGVRLLSSPWPSDGSGLYVAQAPTAVHAERSADAPAAAPAPEAAASSAGSLGAVLSRLANCGELCVQEVASMLPACLLAPIRPGHAVLDLCCAPGSKTSQLLDLMVASASANAAPATAAATAAAAPPAAGVLVANDLERPRAERALRRLWSQPGATRVLMMCSDARTFVPPAIPRAAPPAPPAALRFERVLVDAPCSGDGTLRKNARKWERWSVRPALANHATQLAILQRALRLLRPGGRLAYSTCSLNPIENEAVVHAALSRARAGADVRGRPLRVRLVPAAQEVLSEAAARACHPGLRSWGVPTPGYCEARPHMLRSAAELADEEASGAVERGALQPTMFAPRASASAGGDDADGGALDLTRCIRVLPSAADCGGFFAALIEREQHGDDDDDDDDDCPGQAERAEADGAHPRGGHADGCDDGALAVGADSPLQPGADATAAAPVCRSLADAHPPSAAELAAFFGLGSGVALGREGQASPLELAVPRAARPAGGEAAAAAAVATMETDGANQPHLVVLVERAALRLQHADPPLGCGLPAFARMPPGCDWPLEHPWRICQQSAQIVGRWARRRVIRLPQLHYARLLRERVLPPAELMVYADHHVTERYLGLLPVLAAAKTND